METILRGKMSTFGGPDDTGVGPDEGLSLVTASNFNLVREFFLEEQPDGTTGLARRLNPETFYIACRWNFHDTPKAFLVNTLVTVRNPQNGQSQQAKPVDFGPGIATGRIADLSPGLADALGLDTDDVVEVTIPSSQTDDVPTTQSIDFRFLPAKAFKHGRTASVQSIIVHSTDGRKGGDIATLTGDEVSVHWYVTRGDDNRNANGDRVPEIFHFVDNADTAFHVGKATDPKFSNSASIGIEQEHFDPDAANGHPHNENWPDEQIATVANLCAFLMQRHNLTKQSIHSHASVAAPAGRKQDPFDYPFSKLFDLIDRAMQSHWEASNINGD